MRESGARQHGDRRRWAGLANHIVQQLAAAFLDALGAEDQRSVANRRLSEHGAHVLGRGYDQPGVAAVQIGKFRRRADRWVERDAGQEDRILVAVVHRLDNFALERPEQGFAAAGRSDLR